MTEIDKSMHDVKDHCECNELLAAKEKEIEELMWAITRWKSEEADVWKPLEKEIDAIKTERSNLCFLIGELRGLASLLMTPDINVRTKHAKQIADIDDRILKWVYKQENQ